MEWWVYLIMILLFASLVVNAVQYFEVYGTACEPCPEQGMKTNLMMADMVLPAGANVSGCESCPPCIAGSY